METIFTLQTPWNSQVSSREHRAAPSNTHFKSKEDFNIDFGTGFMSLLKSYGSLCPAHSMLQGINNSECKYVSMYRFIQACPNILDSRTRTTALRGRLEHHCLGITSRSDLYRFVTHFSVSLLLPTQIPSPLIPHITWKTISGLLIYTLLQRTLQLQPIGFPSHSLPSSGHSQGSHSQVSKTEQVLLL